MAKKRLFWLIVLLVLAGILAAVVFFPKDELAELKRTEVVVEGTEEAVKLIRDVVDAAAKRDVRRIASCMYTPDKTEMERVTAPLFESPEMGELEVLKCERLVRSSRRDNLTIRMRSKVRGKIYLFVVVKDDRGDFKLYDIGLAR